jgi:hypothetical protein
LAGLTDLPRAHKWPNAELIPIAGHRCHRIGKLIAMPNDDDYTTVWMPAL